MKITGKDYMKAIKKADREIEIERFGKIVSMCPTRVHKSRKAYTRKMKHIKKIIDNSLQD